MQNYSDGAKVGLTLCSQSFLVGGNWGYLSKEHTEYEKLLSLLMSEKGIIKLVEVSNGVIVISDKRVLHELIQSVDSELITNEVLKVHKIREIVERNKCLKFFEDIVRDETTYGNKYSGFSEYSIGIYSSNELSKIRLNGIDYPAFKITLQEVIENFKLLSRFKKVYIKVNVNDTVSFMYLPELLSQDGFIRTVSKSLEISPTGTGVFITIRVEN